MSCSVGYRHSSDLALLWLWCRPATTAPIQPLAWELPYATGEALKKKKKKERKEKKAQQKPEKSLSPALPQYPSRTSTDWLNIR